MGSYSNIITYDFMIIYVKGVLSNIRKNALYRKMINFDIKCDVSRYLQSVNTEIWFEYRF